MSCRFGLHYSLMTVTARKSVLILAGAVCLSLRAMVPAGYMPGNLLAGEFMVLCPSGMQAEFVRQLHPGHGTHDQNVVDADTSCPIGSALQPAFLPADEYPQAVSINLPRYTAEILHRLFAATPLRRYRSRAPPLA